MVTPMYVLLVGVHMKEYTATPTGSQLLLLRVNGVRTRPASGYMVEAADQ